MGTLSNQRPRQDTIESYVGTVIGVADQIYPDEKTRLTAAEWTAAAVVARAALAIQSADAHDEQLAGLGEILRNLADALSAGWE